MSAEEALLFAQKKKVYSPDLDYRFPLPDAVYTALAAAHPEFALEIEQLHLVAKAYACRIALLDIQLRREASNLNDSIV